MFLRGSGISNTTHATSADNSSRHSNASTAPSSADMAGGSSPVDVRNASRAAANEPQNIPDRGPSTKSVSASLFKAPRTWSFGGQKKQSVPPPKDEPPVPDLPPVLTLQTGGAPAPPPHMHSPTSPDSGTNSDKTAFDMGGDFGSMFSGMDKRESLATVREGGAVPRSLTGGRGAPLSPVSPNGGYADRSLSLHDDGVGRQSSVQRQIAEYKKSTPSPVEDEDAKLLRESYSALKFLDTDPSQTATESFYGSRYRRDDEPVARKPIASTSIASNFEKEDNMFEGSVSRYSRNSHRYIPRTTYAPRNKVMTPAQFERYKQDKEKQGMTQKTTGRAPAPAAKQQQQQQQQEDDDEDEINYDGEEDEAEKSRQQTKQRRKQEAHMAVYRQQMMKVTGEQASLSFAPVQRPGLPTTQSAPLLSAAKAPSPKVPSEEDEDEEVPLAILQAHGFPNKARGPSRASLGASTTNLTPSSQPVARGASSGQSNAGDLSNRRASTLPAFARSLPQDPFVGASVSKPALRETLSFHENGQQQHGPLPPGGLVGVIASEERSRAMRRGSPNMDSGRFTGNNSSHNLPNQGYDPVAGIPQHMMYPQGGMQGMQQGMPQGIPPHMMQGMPQQPMMHRGDQAQAQMNQQMQQFMQMQMQFMQMMTMNQNGQGPYPNQPPGGLPASQSMNDLSSSRQSMMGGEPMQDYMDRSARTMSMMQPPSMPMAPMGHPGYAGSMRGSVAGAGYTPSIAPSERSNVGLPGRYRTVSQATPSPRPSHSERLSAMSGALDGSDGSKSRSSLNISKKSPSGSDDDEEEGWEAMKAKREKKRHLWKRKKDLGSDLMTSV